MSRNFNPSNPDFLRGASPVVTAAPFTVSAWGRVPDTLANYSLWFTGRDDAVLHNWSIIFHNSGVLRYRVVSSSATNIDHSAFSVNTWHHVAVVEIANNDRRVFLDGDIPTTNSTTITPTSIDRTSVGLKDDAVGSNAYKGDIAHVAVWDVALPDGVITTLSKGVSPLRVYRDNLIAYWPLNGQSPEIDVVGGLDLTLFGTPTVVEEPPIPNSIVAPG